MQKATRTALIMHIFATLPAGHELTVAEIVTRLAAHGHDFDNISDDPAVRARLTQSALARLVSRGQLAVGDHDEHTTWYVPAGQDPEPEPTAATPTAVVPEPRTRPARDAEKRPLITAQDLFVATFTVAVLGLFALIFLIGLANSV